MAMDRIETLHESARLDIDNLLAMLPKLPLVMRHKGLWVYLHIRKWRLGNLLTHCRHQSQSRFHTGVVEICGESCPIIPEFLHVYIFHKNCSRSEETLFRLGDGTILSYDCISGKYQVGR